jgi:hypothetical protein
MHHEDGKGPTPYTPLENFIIKLILLALLGASFALALYLPLD